MNRHLAMILQLINAGIMIPLLLIFGAARNEAAIAITCFVCGGIMLFLSYQMRCKNCGLWPRRGLWTGKYCPGCGAHLDDE